jgi:hypothetical protein
MVALCIQVVHADFGIDFGKKQAHHLAVTLDRNTDKLVGISAEYKKFIREELDKLPPAELLSFAESIAKYVERSSANVGVGTATILAEITAEIRRDARSLAEALGTKLDTAVPLIETKISASVQFVIILVVCSVLTLILLINPGGVLPVPRERMADGWMQFSQTLPATAFAIFTFVLYNSLMWVAIVVLVCIIAVHLARKNFILVSLYLAAFSGLVHRISGGDLCNLNPGVVDPRALRICQTRAVCPYWFSFYDKNANGELAKNDEGFKEFSSLEGPLYVFSIIGEFGTGKTSLINAMLALLLRGTYMEDTCKYTPAEVHRPGKVNADEGVTKGISFLSLDLDELNINAMPASIRNQLLPKKGKIILLDTEGDGEPGHSKTTFATQHILSVVMSSVTIMKTEKIFTDKDQDQLRLLEQLVYGTEKLLSSLDGCTLKADLPDSNEPVLSLVTHEPTSSFFPKLIITPKDSRYVLGNLNNTVNVGDDESIVEVYPNATLDATRVLHTKFKISNTLRSVANYFALLPPTHGIPFVCTPELQALKEPNVLSNCWQCGKACGYGLAYSVANYFLPHVLSFPPKKLSGKLTNGKALVELVDRLFNMKELKNLVNVVTNSGTLETAAVSLKGDFLKSSSDRKNKLPVEDPNCERIWKPHESYCKHEDFLKMWQKEAQATIDAVCNLKTFAESATSKTIKTIVSDLQEDYRNLWKTNVAQCSYSWRQEDTTPGVCTDTCPGYRGNKVTCKSSQGNARAETCCSHLPKPHAISCNQYTYGWDHGDWSECTGSCSTQKRDVYCKRCDKAHVDDNFCDSKIKPSSSQLCRRTYQWKSTKHGCPCDHYESLTHACLSCGEQLPQLDCANMIGSPGLGDYCGKCKSCFGSRNTVTYFNGTEADISRVRVGDQLLGDNSNTPSTVLYTSITSPYQPNKRDMMCIQTDQNHTLTITGSHLMYNSSKRFASRSFNTGDLIFYYESGDLTNKAIYNTSTCEEHDLPITIFTDTGKLVVSNVLVDSYTENFTRCQEFMIWLLKTGSQLLGMKHLGETNLVHIIAYWYDEFHYSIRDVLG